MSCKQCNASLSRIFAVYINTLRIGQGAMYSKLKKQLAIEKPNKDASQKIRYFTKCLYLVIRCLVMMTVTWWHDDNVIARLSGAAFRDIWYLKADPWAPGSVQDIRVQSEDNSVNCVSLTSYHRGNFGICPEVEPMKNK